MLQSIYLCQRSNHRAATTARSFILVALMLSFLWDLNGQSCNPLPTFNRTFTNTTVTTAATFTSENIRITGTVNFNANITLAYCTVLMDPGAILNINNATFGLLYGSRIYGCDGMWKAIKVNDKSSIVFENSVIRDGQQGIVFGPKFNNENTRITGCYFGRNSCSITANHLDNLTFAAFTGNIFKSNISMSVDPPFLSPHIMGVTPINAMRLNDCTGTIGTSGAVNNIEWMTTGVRITGGSNITIKNCVFKDCVRPDNENSFSVGIHSRHSSLTMQSIFSNNVSCSFVNNHRGIRSEQTQQLIIQDALFDGNTKSDIEVINSTNPYKVDISRNIMKLLPPSEQSILLNRAANTGSTAINTRIRGNVMTMPTATLPSSIRVINITTQPGATDRAVIDENQITCPGVTVTQASGAVDGIWVSGDADGYQLSGNIINYVFATAPTSDVTSVGISMQNVDGVSNIVGPDNTITSTRFPGLNSLRDSWLRCGIHTEGSLNVAICKNDVDDTRHSYHFMKNCANIEFGRNIIQDAIIGLEVWDQIPNNHNYRMNRWIGDYYFIQAANNTAPNAQSITWQVDNSNGDPYRFRPPSFSPATWFVSLANGQTSGTPFCDAVVPPPLPPGGFGTPPTGDMVHQFLNNEYGAMSAAAAWDFERNLLSQMIRFPATFAGNTEAEQYYATKVNGFHWKFAKAERLLHEAAVMTPTEQAGLSQAYTNLQSLAESLNQIEVWEGADTLTINPAWQTSKTSLLEQVSGQQTQLETLTSSILSARYAKLEPALEFIRLLPQTTSLETNFRTLLLLKVKQQIQSDWTAADSVSLRAIAYSCPATGGEAVTIAREMLPSPESYKFGREGFDPLCGQGIGAGGEERETPVTRHQPHPASIWPNPANDVLVVDFGGHSFSGILEILNVSGTVVSTTSVKEMTQESLNTTGLSNGVYFLRMVGTGQPAQTHKFTILK